MRNWYMNNTKIVSTCLRGQYCQRLVDKGQYDWECRWPVRVSAPKEEKLVTVFRISQGLSNFDCDVADAIYTLHRQNMLEFGLGNVLRVLSGDPKQSMTKNNKTAILESIRRLCATHIQIDCAQEMAARGKDTRTFYDGPCLRLEEQPGGTFRFPTATGRYHADYLMPLYGYAEAAGQMIYFPPELLDVGGVRNTQENIQLKRYLIRRLQWEKNARKRHGWNGKLLDIAYQQVDRPEKGLFAALGLLDGVNTEGAIKNKRRTVHGYVRSILSAWQRLGYIEEFTDRHNGRTVSGVQIQGEIHDFTGEDT